MTVLLLLYVIYLTQHMPSQFSQASSNISWTSMGFRKQIIFNSSKIYIKLES